MKINLVTPAGKRATDGNRTTADRWARLLRELGHHVRITTAYNGRPADMMIAIHAWRSAEAARRFRDRFPDRPLVVALSGTDINQFIKSDPDTTMGTMETADRLVCLHELARDATPERFHRKLHVIRQSAAPLPGPRAPAKRRFEICVIGHLRDVKDPLRAAMAARRLPAASRIRITHLGKAHTAAWTGRARAEVARNPRYRWLGEVPQWRVRRELARTHAMVISSVAEGGANVVSEAIVAGVPVLASEIPGNVGLLGADYPATFPVKDTAALRRLMLRAEAEPAFLAELARRCEDRARLFRPEAERAAWRELIAKLGG